MSVAAIINCIKFCQKLSEKKQFVRSRLSATTLWGLHKLKNGNRFKYGRTSIDSGQRTGRLSTTWNSDANNKVRNLIMENRRLTVWEIANDIEISDGSAHVILTDNLGMRRVATKYVPKLLLCVQLEVRLDFTQDMLECANGDLDLICWKDQYLRAKIRWKGQYLSRKEPKGHEECDRKAGNHTEEDCHKCFQQWKDWVYCVESPLREIRIVSQQVSNAPSLVYTFWTDLVYLNSASNNIFLHIVYHLNFFLMASYLGYMPLLSRKDFIWEWVKKTAISNSY